MKSSTVGCCVTVALCCDKQSRTSLGSHCTALPFLSFTLNSQFALVEFATCLSFPQPGKILMLSSLATLAELPACQGPAGPQTPVQRPPGARGARLHTVGPQSVLQL